MTASALPNLHTPRLQLRPLTAGDAGGVYAMIDVSRPTFSRWFNWVEATTPETVREYLQTAEGAMTVGTAWHYAIFSEQMLIGRVGLTEIDPVNRSAELGYMLRSDFEGQGAMAEAVAALLTYAFTVGGLHRIVAYVDVDNQASRHVLTRLGFQQEGTLRDFLRHPEGHWRDHDAWSLLEGELRDE